MSSWQELRDINRELALMLLFAPASKRDIAADLFLLATELDNAIHIPSEIMLAAIRLQWWHDALTNDAPSTVPLVQQLQRHYASGVLTQTDLTILIDGWRDRIADDEIPLDHCWRGCWRLVAQVLGSADIAAEAAVIGAHMIALQATPEKRLTPMAGNDFPHNKRLPVWLKIAHYLTWHWQANPTADAEYPMLVWRMLAWRFGITPKRPTL